MAEDAAQEECLRHLRHPVAFGYRRLRDRTRHHRELPDATVPAERAGDRTADHGDLSPLRPERPPDRDPRPRGEDRGLRMAGSILEQMDTLVTSTDSAGRGEAGRPVIGFYTSLSAGNLRATLVDYAQRFPRVERSVACMRACKATTRRLFSAPEVERQGTVTSAPLHRQLDGFVHRDIHRVST